ncbi:MAG: cation transporter [Lachnospiraceae bacterium]|nr:cation transporter [Lachnospiraceae bacterium]
MKWEKKELNVKKDSEIRIAMRVSVISIVINTVLSVFKLAAGIMGRSGAMISDAIHSASDVLSTVIVMIGVFIAGRKSDEKHQYGHERLECVAALMLAMILCITGAGIGYESMQKIVAGGSAALAMPQKIALFGAILSIVVKEWMYWFTRAAAKKINSGALVADAWHHRSDALSSVGAFIGIAGARLGMPVLDPIAGLVISLFIVKASCDIFKDAIDKLVDKSCGSEMEGKMKQVVMRQDGVIAIDDMRTRLFGPKIYVDIEIAADSNLPLSESHEIAQRVHDAVETEFSSVKHCMVHVNPRIVGEKEA